MCPPSDVGGAQHPNASPTNGAGSNPDKGVGQRVAKAVKDATTSPQSSVAPQKPDSELNRIKAPELNTVQTNQSGRRVSLGA